MQLRSLAHLISALGRLTLSGRASAVKASRSCLTDEKAVSKFYSELSNAKNPVFIVGDEGSVAIVSILNLASLVDAKILVMPHGKGLVSPYHPLFMGVVGFAGHASAKRLLADPKVDLVVAIGARFGEFSSNAWDTKSLLNGKLVHIESTESNLTQTPMAKLHVRGCLATIFSHIDDQYRNDPCHRLKVVARTEQEEKIATLSDEEFSASLKMHFELDNINIIIDKNGYQQTGTNNEILRMFDLEKKLNSFNLHAESIDGHSINEIYETLKKFKEIKKPCVLIANTIKGKGFSGFENDNAWHHKVLTKQIYEDALIEINKK